MWVRNSVGDVASSGDGRIAVSCKNIAAKNLDERLHTFVCFLNSFFAVIHITLIQMIECCRMNCGGEARYN